MAGDIGDTGNNSKKNNVSEKASKWLRKLRRETYSPTETIIPKEEIYKIIEDWKNIADNYHKDSNSKGSCLLQIAKEIARRSKDTGDQWILTKNYYIAALSEKSFDESLLNKVLEYWKCIGEIQRSRPDDLTDKQQKDLIIHLTKQGVLDKKLAQNGL